MGFLRRRPSAECLIDGDELHVGERRRVCLGDRRIARPAVVLRGDVLPFGRVRDISGIPQPRPAWPAYGTRQGDTLPQDFSACFAHSLVWLVWQRMQGFGILYSSDADGVMNLKLRLRTFTSAIVCSTFGM